MSHPVEYRLWGQVYHIWLTQNVLKTHMVFICEHDDVRLETETADFADRVPLSVWIRVHAPVETVTPPQYVRLFKFTNWILKNSLVGFLFLCIYGNLGRKINLKQIQVVL